MRLMMTVVLALSLAGGAQGGQCGDWMSDTNVDPISDARIEIAMVPANEGDGGFGVRCENSTLQLALLSNRLIIAEQAGGKRGNIVQLRVDSGKVHELLFLKANTNLWISTGSDAVAALRDIKAGKSIFMRVQEPTGYEDFTFSGNGSQQCMKVLTCD